MQLIPYRKRWFQVLMVSFVLCLLYLYYCPGQTHVVFRILLFAAAKFDRSDDVCTSEYRAFRWLMRFRPRSEPYSLRTLRWIVGMTNLVMPPMPRGTVVETLPNWPRLGLTSQAIRPPGVPIDAPILMYMHGGAFCAGSATAAQSIACRFGAAWGCRVLNIDYRLAPEHKMPAALYDCQAAYQRLVNDNPATPVIVAGDSAGGGLALLLLQWIIRYNKKSTDPLPLPRAGVLISPYADLVHNSRSIRENRTKDIILGFDDDRMLRQIQTWVVPDHMGVSSPLVSARYGEFQGLPPLLITCTDQEILLDDAVHCAEAARDAGVAVRLHVTPGLCHVHPIFSDVFPEANLAALDPRVWFGSSLMERPGDAFPTALHRCPVALKDEYRATTRTIACEM